MVIISAWKQADLVCNGGIAVWCGIGSGSHVLTHISQHFLLVEEKPPAKSQSTPPDLDGYVKLDKSLMF